MSWLLALLVLALVAFFAVKYMKSSTQKQQQEHQSLQNARLDASAHAHRLSEADTSVSSSPGSQNTGASGEDTSTAVGAGVAAVAGAAAAGAAAVSQSSSSASSMGSEPVSLETGNTLSDVREMIKILNLDGPDARRLDISGDELSALRKGMADGIPDNSKLEDVATRLRKMLA